MNRRAILSLAGLGLSTAALAACTTTTSGGVTTLTINVAKIDAYAHAIQSAGTALLADPVIAGLLGPNVALAETAVAAVVAGLTAFDAAAGGAVTVSIDTSGVSAAVQSILTNAQSLLALIQAGVSTSKTALASTISNYIASLATIVALLQVLVASATTGAKAAPVLPMTEARALAVANGAK
jgi:hypothetical protein